MLIAGGEAVAGTVLPVDPSECVGALTVVLMTLSLPACTSGGCPTGCCFDTGVWHEGQLFHSGKTGSEQPGQTAFPVGTPAAVGTAVAAGT